MRLQAAQLDMHRMRLVGRSPGRAALDNAGEAFVFGHFPTDIDRIFLETAAIERIGRQPSP